MILSALQVQDTVNSCAAVSDSVQRHRRLTYVFNFWLSGTLVLRAERQHARMSEIKNLG